MKTPKIKLYAVGFILSTIVCGCTENKNATPGDTAKAKDMVEQNLAEFDTLDFHVFNNKNWDRLHESHADDIKVYWPDGHVTNGIAKHIEDLKALFTYAPDAKITEHPMRVGSGDITAVTGVFTGTFSGPMTLPDGKVVQPTGKSFKLPMATFGVWKDGVMTEEHLFWDNHAFMQQVGLAP
ncbi:ester cyclase [Polluticoccus soli]|uniref:ester cyclase n=1 Tax=Polluticoccus soli TaxID=3034150 RepID=UPI0023E3113C|nr:ester cyclase [Flavipsychrobacter sp. JY13-12]